jgi:hypothetical protein
MKQKEMNDIKSTIAILKQLDRQDLIVIRAGAEMLKARKDIEDSNSCAKNSS